MPTPLEDKEAIRELFSEYCFRMDEFRFAELGALFTADGEWIAPYSRARGPAEIAALMARNIPTEPRRKHFIMNSLIRLDGDRATARTSYLVVLQAAGAGLVPSVAGTYEDRLVRTSDGWRFHERRLVHDLRAELGLNVPEK
ncbi:nuclear transport factor 2 family protein [Reyranella soli]|uniref:SnoaL-like domain-containing protein n=1 Tax=Reyranella soli TaxID=1230389 RepID=A0A512ND64_9HYPH|nr:nuclear transport factor 2 family protein [Reyranella soli]GEP56864.1 hypothetical protein RSO01_40300 [Reyranella soli]